MESDSVEQCHRIGGIYIGGIYAPEATPNTALGRALTHLHLLPRFHDGIIHPRRYYESIRVCGANSGK